MSPALRNKNQTRISFRELHSRKETLRAPNAILSKKIVVPRGGFHSSPAEPRNQKHSYWDQLFEACNDQRDWLKSWVAEGINHPHLRVPAVILTGQGHADQMVIHHAIARLMNPSIVSHRWKSSLQAAEIPEMRLVAWEAGAGWRVPYGDRVRLHQRLFRERIEIVEGPFAYQTSGPREPELVYGNVTGLSDNHLHWIETRHNTVEHQLWRAKNLSQQVKLYHEVQLEPAFPISDWSRYSPWLEEEKDAFLTHLRNGPWRLPPLRGGDNPKAPNAWQYPLGPTRLRKGAR